MSTLAEQQRRLAAAIVADDGDDQAVEHHVGLRSLGRLDVYRSAYRARLTEALRSNYPVLHRVLGDEHFAALAQAYLRAHPSTTPSIRWFGDRLPAWLDATPHAAPHASLADLARMEWALGSSFDSADAPVLSAVDLMGVAPADWPALRFAAHPSVALLTLEWSVEPMWRSLTQDEHAEADAPEAARHALLVWRQGLETRWRSLGDDEAALLRACLTGLPFAQLCEQAAQTAGDDAAAVAATSLRQWIEDGVLSQAAP